ncbi:mucin-associated surface protein [Arthrobacter sp. NPDC093125]|uniref:mucin-associated surface protein n=1 Tax=Arthrobacter sp. NPDC093125 TaxID=3363944 RepID=UPI00380ED1F5
MISFAGLRSALPARASATLAIGLLAFGLVACGGTAPELETDAASQLQQRVLAVTKAAAGNDPAKALKSLEQLSSELDAAAAAGQVSFKRHQSITVAIDSVRTGLASAQAAKKSAAAAAAKAAAAKAAADAVKQSPSPVTAPVVVAPAPAPTPVPDAGEKGRESSGKGNGDEDKDNDKGSGDKD